MGLCQPQTGSTGGKNIRTLETGSTCQISWLSHCILRTQVGSWQSVSLLSHCFYWDPSADQFSLCERSRFASSFPASRNILLANSCPIQSGAALHFSQICGKLQILFRITSIYIPSEESLSFFGSVFQRSIKTTYWCVICTRTCPETQISF